MAHVSATRAVGSLSCAELVGRLKAASWSAAMTNLRSEWSEGRQLAAQRATDYGKLYRGVARGDGVRLRHQFGGAATRKSSCHSLTNSRRHRLPPHSERSPRWGLA